MKHLLSCLLLASHCALSSRSDTSTLRVSQSADIDVFEGQLVNISCCWTGNFSRVKVTWRINATVYGESFYTRQPTLQRSAEWCVFQEWTNITKEDSATYVCQVNVDIPSLMEKKGNGTVIRVTRQRSNGNAEGGKSRSALWVSLGISLASVVLLLLLAAACIYKLKQTKGVSRVIYESPHLDSDNADMDKHSSGSSSAGSAQWV
ncbi:uncharacterized protein LOC109506988 isoform X2 [Hippocampus comes]|uniref:uncharacterized protein LOC109506988 isoform X2 n=1 Tax=Hippocampus comes TaxID=109280 RepID=UPI00094F147A|nr:PREDICTED: uncharacterized protein LOC109506988 isoform X2 [Hippocampus comes]